MKRLLFLALILTQSSCAAVIRWFSAEEVKNKPCYDMCLAQAPRVLRNSVRVEYYDPKTGYCRCSIRE